MTALLEVSNLHRRFGGLKALSNISFAVEKGEIFGIIGPNGAGKTTLFNVIAGLFPPSAGEVHLKGTRISGLTSDAIARRGVGRTFQQTNVFKALTVRENMALAQALHTLHSPGAFAAEMVRRGKTARFTRSAEETLNVVGLLPLADQQAGALPYGSQKVLGVSMALMQNPNLVLMDEPAAGLNSTEKLVMAELILRIRNELGVTVLVVEHDMKLIMNISDRILVISYGQHVAIGSPSDIKNDQAVIDAYLGVDYELA